MSTAIILLALIVVVIFAVRSYMRKLTCGCCGAGEGAVKRIPVSDQDPKHYPFVYELQISGMTCENCSRRLENAFHEQEGLWAQANENGALLRSKRLLGETEIRAIVQKAGYSLIKCTRCSI